MRDTFAYGPSRRPRDLLRRARRGSSRLVRVLMASVLVALGVLFAVIALPRLVGYSALVVRGSSMGTAAPLGSLVIARPLAAEEVRKGDVILLQAGARDEASPPVLHRVTSIDVVGGQRVIETRGDANDSPDPQRYVLTGRTLSPVVVIPYLGFLIAYAKTPVGWVISSAIPGVVVCVLWLRAIWSPARVGGSGGRVEGHRGWASA